MKNLKKLLLLLAISLVITTNAEAANRYWVGGTASWDATAGTKWALTSGGTGGEAVPTSADDVYFDAASGTYTVTVAATANCANLNFTGFTGTFAGASVLNIYGSLTLGAGMTRTYTGNITFRATSGIKTITSNGKSLYYITFNGSGGTFQLVDTLTIDGSYTVLALTAGTFNANGQTVSFTGAQPNISGSFTFYNLTRIGTTAKTDFFSFGANQTITGTLTLNGYSTTSRLLVKSNAAGAPRTLTAAIVSVSNADFQDITGAGAASWDLSGATGGSGNCGGNTMQGLGDAAFTTAAPQTWSGTSGGNWSANAWTSRVPLPQDDVIINAAFSASQTVTADMPRLGKSIDFTGALNTPAFAHSVGNSIFGSLNLTGATIGAGTSLITFEGRGSYTLTTNDLSFDFSVTLNAPTGTLTLQDALTLGTGAGTRTLTINSGTFNANNQDVTTGLLDASLNYTRTITMGSGTWTLTGTGTVWNMSASVGTIVNANTSTIKITDTSNTAITFAGGGKIYNNVWFSREASTAANTISGNNTFADFKDTGTAAHSILFTAASTQTVTTFTVSGTSGNVITLESTTATGHYHLIKSGGGTISCDYLNIQHSVATPDTLTWYAGANSVNNQADNEAGSGWIFTAPPGGSSIKTINGLVKSSCKTWNGLGIGSVKSFNGLQ